MNYKTSFTLTFKNLSPGELLYSDIDLSRQDVVKAEYRKVPYCDNNPDICSLPAPLSPTEVMSHNMFLPEMIASVSNPLKLSEAEKFIYLSEVRHIQFPLPFHADVEQAIHSLLRASFSRRKFGLPSRCPDITINGETFKQSIRLAKKKQGGTEANFAIIGSPGTGKSTALQATLSRIPNALEHVFYDHRYVEIPVIDVSAPPNSNLRQIFALMGEIIDERLDTGKYYKNLIEGKKSLGEVVSIIIDLIQSFHVGLLVIDEFQFISLNAGQNNSFEQFVFIMAVSGVSILIVGNHDGSKNMDDNSRIYRRFANVIHSNALCKNRDFLICLFQNLYRYRVVDMNNKPDPEVVSAFVDESLGSIDILTLLFVAVQSHMLKNSIKTFTPSLITKVSNCEFSNLKSLFKKELLTDDSYLKESDRISKQYSITKQSDDASSTLSRAFMDLDPMYDSVSSMRKVTDIILCCYKEYTRKKVEHAFHTAEAIVEGFMKFSTQDMVQSVLMVLKGDIKKISPKKRKHSSTTDEEIKHLQQQLGLQAEGDVS